MTDLFKLEEIVLDERAQNGTWCKLPYHGHPNGCPNANGTCTKGISFAKLMPKLGEQINTMRTHWITYQWYAVVEEFDLKNHAAKMKEKHPDWTDRQCRNLLYWQNGVRSRLEKKAKIYRKQLATEPSGFCHDWACHLIEIPEAHGVNVFETMAKVGVILQRNPDIVKKVMFIGINQTTPITHILEGKL